MPEPLSILQVCSASQATYGAVQSLMTLARAQRAAGHRVEFLTFKGKRFGAQVRDEGFAVHEVRVRAKVDPVAIAKMRRVMRRGRFDVVHTHLSTSSVNGCLAAKAARVPSVATVHGMSGKLSFAAADHLIAVSEQVKAHLVDQGVRGEKVSVVYNGLDLDLPDFDRAEARRRVGIAGDGPVLGTVARVTAAKGIDDALHALAEISLHYPNLRYLVVGDGDALPECRDLAKVLGLEGKVKFAGYQKDVATYLAAMDLFLFPSHKEAMGIALVEAMRVGVPIVGTNIGGIPEVVTPDCGILVPDRSPRELASGALTLLGDPARAAQASQAAIRRANQVFSADAMQRSTDAVYHAMLGRPIVLPLPPAIPESVAQ